MSLLCGAYFIIICTQNSECLFGEMIKKITFNDAGSMVVKWHHELENKFVDIKCDEFVCMPNHVYFIVINGGADLCVCPDKTSEYGGSMDKHIGSPLHRIIQWFKKLTS